MFSPFRVIRQESIRKLLAERDVWQKRIAELERRVLRWQAWAVPKSIELRELKIRSGCYIAELERENTELFSIASGLTQRIDKLQSTNAALKNKVRELEGEIAELVAGEDL